MHNTRRPGSHCVDGAKGAQRSGYVETDPSGRYGRIREILGKGAMKTVYKAFDEVLGMEVAWNQIKLNDVFRSPEELERLYSEVHLLKNLNHDSVIRFYTSWIDIHRRTFNFITEMFTSGTLREYRQKHPQVDIRAVKNWARQILRGIAYLHGLYPSVIHRDLKCDNIFVNGHLGQVKIGDLGLAAVLRGSKLAHSVIGTPEFMAPELYEEEYNELVDIYSFGMCVLEMLTSEYPYSECSNPAQIYKKVTSGKLPAAFYRIQDEEAKRFVGLCLQNVSKRLPARELLLDPFLACDDDEGEPLGTPKNPNQKPLQNGKFMEESSMAAEPAKSTEMTITGTMHSEDDTIFLKVLISDKNGDNGRNIYFPFDIFNDTAIDVAMEMVKELEISDWEPSEIAHMIEKEISSLIPSWKVWGTSPKEHHDHDHDHQHQQHSFSYEEEEDDDDDIVHNPFFSSSCSSSHSSFQAVNSLQFRPGTNWLQDDALCINDDSSSQCSLNSFNYSNINYCSGHEDDDDTSLSESGELHPIALMPQKSTRFCPAETLSTANHYKHCRSNKETHRACGLKHHKPLLSRIQSFMDLRSQLLHRSLVEEIHKRRLFNTVGSVENIGFQEIQGKMFKS